MKKLSLILAALMLCTVLTACNPYAGYIMPEDLGISEDGTPSSPSIKTEQGSYYTRRLSSKDWTVDVYERVTAKGSRTLSSRRYAMSDDTNVYMCRLEGEGPQASLFHAAFSCGGTIHFYDKDRKEWSSERIENTSYQALFAYLELDNGQSMFLLLPKTFNVLENGVIEYLPDCDGSLRISGGDGHWSLDVLSSEEESGALRDCLVQVSPQKLIDTQFENIATYWAKYANGSEAFWCYDGYFRIVPNEYTPSKRNAYYRCIASYLPRTLTEIPNVLDTDISILIPMMDAIALVQNAEGYWETTPLSNWLQNDFSIGPGFYDTRFNTELVNIYVKLDSFFGKGLFDSVINRYNTFYINMAIDNHIETANGGWLVEDYWYREPHRPTHTSLNHQAAECLLMYNMSRHYLYPDNNVSNDSVEMQKAVKVQRVGDLLLRAIEDTGREWIMPDNNLYYSRSQEGVYTEGDYPQLTYTDLYRLQEYLAEENASRNEMLDVLMRAKRIWMDNNNVSNYLR